MLLCCWPLEAMAKDDADHWLDYAAQPLRGRCWDNVILRDTCWSVTHMRDDLNRWSELLRSRYDVISLIDIVRVRSVSVMLVLYCWPSEEVM
jgi:hypothetical protein